MDRIDESISLYKQSLNSSDNQKERNSLLLSFIKILISINDDDYLIYFQELEKNKHLLIHRVGIEGFRLIKAMILKRSKRIKEKA